MTEQQQNNQIQKKYILFEISASTIIGIISLLLFSVVTFSSTAYFVALSEAKVSMCKAIAMSEKDKAQVFKSLQECLEVAER